MRKSPIVFRVLALVPLLIASGCASMSACPARGGPAWTQVTSPHFKLRTDIPTAEARDLIATLEETRAAMVMLGWPGQPEPPGQISVVAFASRSSLSDLADRDIVVLWHHQSPFPNTVVIAQPDRRDGLRLLTHGLAYSLIHHFSPLAPQWYVEGLSSYLESVRYDRAAGLATASTETLVRYHDLLRLNLLKTREIVSTDESPRGVALARYQSSAWLLVQYLLDNRTTDFRTLQRRLGHLENPRAAWSSVFDDLSMKEWDERLYRYAGAGKFTPRALPLKLPQTEPSVSLMSDAEVHGLRAFLFGVIGKTRRGAIKRARGEIAESMRQKPGSIEALAVDYHLSLDDDESRAALAQEAAELFPNQWLSWVMAADTTTLAGPAAVDAVERAAKLAPDEPEVLARLAIVRANQDRLAESVSLSTRALALGATNLMLFYVHTYASALTGDCPTAERYLAILRHAAPHRMPLQQAPDWPRLLEQCRAISAKADAEVETKAPPTDAATAPAASPAPEQRPD